VWECCDTPDVDGSDMKAPLEADMRSWHALDAVDTFEMDRNDKVYYNWQQNRNPYIDHPEWVDQIADF